MHNREDISYLQFADDTVLFCSATTKEVVTMKRILRCFQLVSGLKVNFSKSSLVGVGCFEDLVRSLASAIRCRVGKLLILYLGLPVGPRTSSMALWNPVVEKVEKKLSTRKMRYLSLGGRITMIKACLSKMPVYYMSLFKMPKSVIGKLDKLSRNFLWEGRV